MASDRLGIALSTLGDRPINGMRIHPDNGTCEWSIYGGTRPSDTDDFYDPLCFEHVIERWPTTIPFLALPTEWRFIVDDTGYVDAWFDLDLLET